MTSRQKRYSFTDPLLRLWVRLHCRPTPPTTDDVAREVQRYALARLPHAENRLPRWPTPASMRRRTSARAGELSRSTDVAG